MCSECTDTTSLSWKATVHCQVSKEETCPSLKYTDYRVVGGESHWNIALWGKKGLQATIVCKGDKKPDQHPLRHKACSPAPTCQNQ